MQANMYERKCGDKKNRLRALESHRKAALSKKVIEEA